MSYMSEMLAEFERGEYRQLKGVALASLECQVAGHQEAFDQCFAEAASPGVIWKLVERHQALLAEFEKLKAYSAHQERRIEALAVTHVLYTWLRKKCDEPSNDVVAVHMNIGHDWAKVIDLDRDLRAMIEQEEP